MRQRVLAATVVGGVLAGAGILGLVSTPEKAVAQEESSEPTEAQDVRQVPIHGSILEEVLSDLVADGTIDQGQAEAIRQAYDDKTETFRSAAKELGGLIRQFLADGAIDSEELARLSAYPPFQNLDWLGDALDDGVVTGEELSRLLPRLSLLGAHRSGLRRGALFDDGGIDTQEYEALPENHPLRDADVTEALSDGVISLDEFRDLMKSQSSSGDSA